MCERKKSGKLLVPVDVADAFKNGGEGRNKIIEQFVQCGHDKDLEFQLLYSP